MKTLSSVNREANEHKRESANSSAIKGYEENNSEQGDIKYREHGHKIRG